MKGLNSAGEILRAGPLGWGAPEFAIVHVAELGPGQDFRCCFCQEELSAGMVGWHLETAQPVCELCLGERHRPLGQLLIAGEVMTEAGYGLAEANNAAERLDCMAALAAYARAHAQAVSRGRLTGFVAALKSLAGRVH